VKDYIRHGHVHMIRVSNIDGWSGGEDTEKRRDVACRLTRKAELMSNVARTMNSRRTCGA